MVGVLWRTGLVISLVLVIVSGLTAYLRTEPSPAYWLITEKTPDTPQFYGYYLMDSSGEIWRRIDTATAASNSTWFVTWSPDGRYVFTRVADNRDGQPHGLYVYDLRSKEQRLVLPTDIGRFPLQMILSPDGQWYAATIPDGDNETVYLISQDGRDVRKPFPENAVLVGDPQNIWSPDSKWVSFRHSNENPPQINRLNIDSGDTEPTGTLTRIPSPDGKSAVVLDADTLEWLVHNRDQDTRTPIMSDQPIQSIIAWLPTNWLLVWNQHNVTPSGQPERVSLSRMRPDGSDHAVLVDVTPDELSAPLWLSFWSDDGQYIYYAGRGPQGNFVRRINVNTSESQLLIEGQLPTNAVPVSLENNPRGSFSVLWARSDWLVWYDRDRVGLEYYYQVRPDGSQHRLLYKAPPLSNNLRAYEDPTGRGLVIDFWENELGFDPRDKRIVRVDLDTRAVKQLSSSEHRVVAISDLIDQSHRSLLWVVVGVVLSLVNGGWYVLRNG